MLAERGETKMHSMTPALPEMVAAVTLDVRRAAEMPVDPGELERYAQRVLGDLHRSRPRILSSLPELSVERLLAVLARQPRLN
jgi:hypothetical protein